MLRVVTANLGGPRTGGEALASLLEDIRPDVVAAQELTGETARVLAAHLPFGRHEPLPEGKGLGLALRHAAPLEEIPLPYRSALSARLEGWPGLPEAVEVVAVHLLGPHAWPPWRTWVARPGQAAALARHLQESRGPLALMGDLNATPAWPAYRRLTRRLTDEAARLAVERGDRPAPTWAPRYGWPRLLRIDHLLVRGLEATRVEVVPVARSDHDALVAELRLR